MLIKLKGVEGSPLLLETDCIVSVTQYNAWDQENCAVRLLGGFTQDILGTIEELSESIIDRSRVRLK